VHDDEEEELFNEAYPDVIGALSNNLKSACSVKGLQRRVPIMQWLPAYKKSFFMKDVVAGISVGLTAIPQGIAYAVVAGLPPQYGLYSGFMGKFLIASLQTRLAQPSI